MAFDYQKYWEDTYAGGGNSGSGSYGVLAKFKADVINALIDEMQIDSIIEFGCGDGHQTSLLAESSSGPFEYLGLDIAPSSVRICAEKFKDDPSKSFMLYTPKSFVNRGILAADLVLCLDVLYPITDEEDFRKTLDDVFSCARNHVVLYTKITDASVVSGVHTIEDRDIFKYLADYPFDRKVIQQKHPELSSAHFILLERR